MEAAHNNGNPLDNRLTNLRWATKRSNASDKLKHGTNLAGLRNPNRILDDVQVREIITKRNECGTSYRRLAEEYGVTFAHIGRIVRGENWRCAND